MKLLIESTIIPSQIGSIIHGGAYVSIENLRDRNGHLLGWIKEVNGNYELRDASGRLLGRYNPKTNVTIDRSGRLVGRGNLLAALINNK